jgi:hypothetical protein
VIGPFPVRETAVGEKFVADSGDEETGFWLDQGLVELVGAKDAEETEPEKVPCPACVEQDMQRPPKFDSPDELKAHYAEKHPALVAPDSLPAPEREEE